MTGRDLIIYILQNHLEDEPIYKDGSFLGFMTDSDTAIKFDVGIATIRACVKEGILDGVYIGDKLYIPSNAQFRKKNNC